MSKTVTPRYDPEVPARGSAKYILTVRKAASAYLGDRFGSSPALYLMLAIYAFGSQAKHLKIGSVSRRAGVPRTTTIRWLSELQRGGFVSLSEDKQDKRAVRVQLTPRGYEGIKKCFIAAKFIGPSL